MTKVTLINAHVLQGLARLPDESVHCVVTSPPYWGLRDYGLEPQIWGGEAECEHAWGEQQKSPWADKVPGPHGLQKNTAAGHWKPKETGPFCRLCGAWRGSLGLEPSIDLYVDHLVEIFREVRRVMRPEATLWLNIADSYYGGGGAHKEHHANPGLSRSASRHGVPKGRGARGPGKVLVCRNRQQPILKPKDLCGVPWHLVLALQADGWWWRSVVIWCKENGMPESCEDRPTTSHEYLFLLTKSENYFFDQEAVREPHTYNRWSNKRNRDAAIVDAVHGGQVGKTSLLRKGPIDAFPHSGRNLRSVWIIPTVPLSCGLCKVCGRYWHNHAPQEHCGRQTVGHFAAFPPKLVEICVQAGASEKGCCPQCGAPWERIVEKTEEINESCKGNFFTQDKTAVHQEHRSQQGSRFIKKTVGWRPTCSCEAGSPVPCTAADIFSGAGTTPMVAAKLGRDAAGVELNPDYVEMSRRRLSRELGMLADIRVNEIMRSVL
jgi:DNA modification methylase